MDAMLGYNIANVIVSLSCTVSLLSIPLLAKVLLLMPWIPLSFLAPSAHYPAGSKLLRAMTPKSFSSVATDLYFRSAQWRSVGEAGRGGLFGGKCLGCKIQSEKNKSAINNKSIN